MPYGPEPTDAEQRVIDEMRERRPTWRATRRLGGWAILDGEGAELAWNKDVFVARETAEGRR